MPKSYLLYDKYNIDLFKKEYNSNEIYILKKIFKEKKGYYYRYEWNIRRKWDGYRIVQKYMQNLFLVNLEN